MNQSNQDLIQHLESVGVLRNASIKDAMLTADRVHFVPDDYKVEAYEDYALPIGFDQTISQPTTVAFMLEKLGAKHGDRVLDVGSGSGWTTALLGHIVGESGHVYGLEKIPELVEFGRENLRKILTTRKNVEIRQAGDELGLPTEAPFDRILVSAAADAPRHELVEQLNEGGVMVIPVQSSIYRITKDEEDKTHEEEFPGFAFVPLRQ